MPRQYRDPPGEAVVPCCWSPASPEENELKEKWGQPFRAAPNDDPPYDVIPSRTERYLDCTSKSIAAMNVKRYWSVLKENVPPELRSSSFWKFHLRAMPDGEIWQELAFTHWIKYKINECMLEKGWDIRKDGGGVWTVRKQEDFFEAMCECKKGIMKGLLPPILGATVAGECKQLKQPGPTTHGAGTPLPPQYPGDRGPAYPSPTPPRWLPPLLYDDYYGWISPRNPNAYRYGWPIPQVYDFVICYICYGSRDALAAGSMRRSEGASNHCQAATLSTDPIVVLDDIATGNTTVTMGHPNGPAFPRDGQEIVITPDGRFNHKSRTPPHILTPKLCFVTRVVI